MKKLILVIIVLVAVGAGVAGFYMRRGTPEPEVRTAPITRGDIVDSVQATGTLEAVTTVQVGTQVSGTVQDLYADFNSIVRKGQVIARLDPSLLQTNIEQQRANVTRSRADLDRLKVSLADAEQKLERAKTLFEKNLLPRTELETAEVNVKSQEASIKSSEAGLTQARSQLNTAEVNMAHTVIAAPIDGIVISRNVEPGQTVAASMSAPTLYVLAADLTQMQVNANIDEADVGRMRPGQVVTFRVDAFPTDTFTGEVQQVRLQPTTVQNVVTYQTVIAVPNAQLKLKPGMTANVTIEVSRRSNVLRIPSAATRFRPTPGIYAALKQEPPPDQRGGLGPNAQGGRSGLPRAPGGTGTTALQTQAPAQPREPRQGSAEARGGGARGAGPGGRPGEERSADGGSLREGRAAEGGRGGFDTVMTPEQRAERRKRMQERMAAMTPEERTAFEARMRERGQGGQGGGRGGFGGGDRPGGTAQQGANAGAGNRAGAQRGRVASTPSITSGATTIDSLFGPLPPVESRGRAYLYVNRHLKAVSLRLGVSDGAFTEVLDGEGLTEGTEVVVNVMLPDAQRPPAGTGGGNTSPLMGPQRGGPGNRGGGR